MSEELPKAVYEGVLDVCGLKLEVVVLEDGRRLFKDTPEFRAIMHDLVDGLRGINTDEARALIAELDQEDQKR